jgi:hypothetical protein
MDKATAEALAPIVVAAIKEHAQKVVGEMTPDERDAQHPQALAALDVLANIKGEFCVVAPKINKAIDDLGWVIRVLYAAAYALLKTFQAIVQQMQAVLCQPAAA